MGSIEAAKTAVDPRILMSRVERGIQAIGSAAAGSPPWIFLAAILASGHVGYFGSVDTSHAVTAVTIVFSASLIARLGFYRFQLLRLDGTDAAVARDWFRRTVALNLLMSSAWGLVAWLLWQPGHLSNHLFIALISLSVVGRFLVSRGGHMAFFTASFGPMALFLFARLLTEAGVPELMLVALVLFYALHFAFDVRRHSSRMDSDAGLRFANEDLAHALEHARDEALRKRNEAENANESKTTFLANMSHELRTPLNAILGFSEIIARECLGPIGSPRYKEYAGDIHNSGAHLLSLINELLDVAKIEAGRMEIEPNFVDTRPLFENTLKLLAIRARERTQTLSLTVAAGAETFYADERAFKQILINLASNAIKFTQEGGHIGVEARRGADGTFELVVADNGPGILKETFDLVFKPFAQVDNRYDRKAPGTGLGLALVRGLAQLHGGRAWIESEPGMGTRAFVVLPVPASADPAARAA